MKKVCIFFLISLITGCGNKGTDNELRSQEKTEIIAQDAQIRKLAGDFKFTEGPAADADGNVYFTDQPNDRIMIWSTNGELSTFLQPCQRCNGTFFSKNGHLLACADEFRRLVSISMDGNMNVLLDNFAGKKLNGPNDLWLDPKGGIYFTDPYYERPWWNPKGMEQDGQHVYYLKPDGKTAIRVVDDLEQPNGIIGTPDGKKLYVADIRAQKTWSYSITDDGKLTNKTFFAPEGSDGMTLDEKGNVYLTNRTVSVFSPSGKKIAAIDVPEWPANVCFGGTDRKCLFITARTSLYALQMNVNGVY
ncbi:SMP-30/gluconolactonase/LRE family protein [candidate division KSB1 bacterium]|nr:SMP-30/gluconolactonase/LRE family protein [candidate division KSB1 bacterium]